MSEIVSEFEKLHQCFGSGSACNFVWWQHKIFLLWQKFDNCKPGSRSGSGIRSGSVFVRKAGCGSAYDECRSETRVNYTPDTERMLKMAKRKAENV
jgi:hypothetical protein